MPGHNTQTSLTKRFLVVHETPWQTHEDSWYRRPVLGDTRQRIALAAAESLALD